MRNNRVPAVFGVFSLIVASVFLGDSSDPFDPPKLLVVITFAVAAAAVFLYRAITEQRIALPDIPGGKWLLLLWIWMGLSSMFAYNRPLAADAFARFTAYCVLFVAAARSLREPRDAEKASLWMLASAFPVTLFGLTDYFRWNFFPFDALLDNRFYSVFKSVAGKHIAAPQWDGFFDGRISSTFGNPTYLAGFLLLTLPVALSLFFTARTPRRRLYAGAVSLCLAGCLLLTFTRSAWIIFLVEFVFVCLLLLRAEIRGPRVARSSVVIFLAVSFILSASFYSRSGMNPSYSVKERVASVSDTSDGSFRQRLLIWKTTGEMIRRNLLTGVGPGNFMVHHPLYQKKFFTPEWTPHISFPDRVHNDPLEIFAELGVVGFVLYSGFFATLFIVGWKRISSTAPEEVPLRIGLWWGLAGLTAYSLVQFPMHVVATAAHFWLFAGLTVASPSERPVRELSPRREFLPREKALVAMILALLGGMIIFNAASPLRANLLYFIGTRMESVYPRRSRIIIADAVDLAPRNQEFVYHLCGRLLTDGHGVKDEQKKASFYIAAVETCSDGIRLFPNMSLMLNNRGNAYLYLGRRADALRDYQKSVDLEPNYPPALYNLGIAYYQLEMYNYAQIAFGAAARLDDRNAAAFYNLGLALARTGKPNAAVSAYRRAISLDRNNAPFHAAMGRAQLETGDAAGAVSSLRKALRIDPDAPGARGNLAVAYIRGGRANEGLAVLQRLLRNDPDNSVAAYYTAVALKDTGRRGEAISWARRALRLRPGDANAARLIKTLSER